jgi:hypothetical protein
MDALPKNGISLHRLLVVLLCGVLTLMLLPSTARAETADLNLPIESVERYDFAWKVLAEVNKQRADAGAPPLTMDAGLLDAAMLRSAECQLSFDHTRPTGELCWTAFPSTAAGAMAENIAAGQTTPAQVMNSWMNSAGHKTNILNASYTSIGIGCVEYTSVYNRKTYTWTQCFSSAAGSNPTQPVNTKRIRDIAVSTAYFPVDFTVDYYSPGGAVPTIVKDLEVGRSPGWRVAVFVGEKGANTSAFNLPQSRVTWKGSSPSVASVANGIVSPKATGKTTLSAYLAGKKVAGTSFTIKVHPKQLSLKAPKRGAKRFTARWKKAADITKYQVSWRLKGAKTWKTKTVAASKTALPVKGLKARRVYHVRLRSYKTVAGVKYYSDWSTVKKVTTKERETMGIYQTRTGESSDTQSEASPATHCKHEPKGPYDRSK